MIQIHVLEETPSQVYLVLPQAQAQVGSERSQEELESVSGGWTMGMEHTCINNSNGKCAN